MHKEERQLTITIKIIFKDGKQHKEVILQWLEQAGIDPRRRGETPSIQDFAKLYEEKKKFPQLEN